MLTLPLALILAAVVMQYSGFDLWWVSHFYDRQRRLWPYRNSFFFSTIIHTGGQWFDRAVIAAWIAVFISACLQPSLRRHRKLLLYFLAATATGPIVVSIWKNISHLSTPWDLTIFHGKYPYSRLFDTVPPYVPVGHAFPAGHASGGYCFMSLFFVFNRLRPAWRRYGLWAGLLLGLVYGLGQQVRGAHFPSHDLFTLAICWYASMLMYWVFYERGCSIAAFRWKNSAAGRPSALTRRTVPIHGVRHQVTAQIPKRQHLTN